MPKVKRDNKYFLDRFEKEFPATYSELVAGKITVAEARKRHSMGGQRTRLHEMKNAWGKASGAERREFLAWIKGGGPTTAVAPSPAAKVPSRPPAPSGAAFDPSGRLTANACRRIEHIMKVRGLRSGDLAAELGLVSRSDTSVMTAIRRGSVLATNTRVRLEAWLGANSTV